MSRIWLVICLCSLAAWAQPVYVKFAVDPAEAGVYLSDGSYLGPSASPLPVEIPRDGGLALNLYHPDYERYPVRLSRQDAEAGRYPADGQVRLAPRTEFVRWKRILGQPAVVLSVVVVGALILVPLARRWRRLQREARHGRQLATLQAQASPASLAGTLAMQRLGDYQLIEVVGRGSFGVVYRAFPADDLEGPPAAVKVMQQGLSEDDLKRFKREIVVCRSLVHPGIVQLLDFGDQDGLPYYVMEFVAGQTLRDLQPPDGMEAATAWRDYLKPLLEAMAFAHDQRIVHRDLKPDNVMVDARGRLKIMDFGLARAVEADKLTGTGDALGTPSYMAPEQISGNGIDERIDQYAIGVIAYELVTGQRPFRGGSIPEVLIKQLTEDPPPISALRAVPAGFEAAVLRMLAKEPEHRFADLREAARALEEGLA